jgi:GNAT superfamily N-acetyltransferase
VATATRIRKMTSDDIPATAILASQLAGHSFEIQNLRHLFASICADPSHALFVAQLNGEVVGWIHVYAARSLLQNARVEIGALVVNEACRRQGIGALLIREAEAWARTHGITAIRLASRIHREEAHRFYEREGFAIEKTSLIFRKTL